MHPALDSRRRTSREGEEHKGIKTERDREMETSIETKRETERETEREIELGNLPHRRSKRRAAGMS
jgi:hypothetical protein